MKKLNQILALTILFSIAAGSIFSMEPEWHTYTTSNSLLPSNWILSLAKEQNNNIWAGTFSWPGAGVGGVVKISGSGWTVYDTSNSGIRNNSVISIVVDNNNVKWFGCSLKFDTFTSSVLDSGGVSRFNGSAWTSWINNFIYSDNIQKLTVNPLTNEIWSANGTLFVSGTPLHQPVAKFNGSNWSFFQRGAFNLPNNNSFRTIAADNNGIIWIGTINNGLIKFDGTNYTIYNNSNSPMPSNNVYELEVAPDGKLWVGCDGGLAKFDGTNWNVYRINNSGLPYPMVMSIAFENNFIWVGTLNGMARFDGNSEWIRYDTTNCPIPGGVVDVILVDNLGNKWLGTRDFAVSYGLTVFKEGGIVGIDPVHTTASGTFKLNQNYPNPFNPLTTISFEIQKPSFVSLKVYNSLGKELTSIVNRNLNSGKYDYVWDAVNESSGIYFYTLSYDNTLTTKKMVLVK